MKRLQQQDLFLQVLSVMTDFALCTYLCTIELFKLFVIII